MQSKIRGYYYLGKAWVQLKRESFSPNKTTLLKVFLTFYGDHRVLPDNQCFLSLNQI